MLDEGFFFSEAVGGRGNIIDGVVAVVGKMHETAESVEDEIVCEIFRFIGRECGCCFRIAGAVLRREIDEEWDVHHVPRERAVTVEELEIFAVIGGVEQDLQVQMIARVFENALQDLIRVQQRRIIIVDLLRMARILNACVIFRDSVTIRVVAASESEDDEMRAFFRDFFQTFQDLRIVAADVFREQGFLRIFVDERDRHVSVKISRIADVIHIIAGLLRHIGNRDHVGLFSSVILVEIGEVHGVRFHGERVIGIAAGEEEETGIGGFFCEPRRRVDGIIRLKRFHVRAIGRFPDDENDSPGKGLGSRGTETELPDILRVKGPSRFRFGQIAFCLCILHDGKQFHGIVLDGNDGGQEEKEENHKAWAGERCIMLRPVSAQDKEDDGEEEEEKRADGSGKDAVTHVRGNKGEGFFWVRQKDRDHVAFRESRAENAPIADTDRDRQREIRDEKGIDGREQKTQPRPA